jgi:hypothetical protein
MEEAIKVREIPVANGEKWYEFTMYHTKVRVCSEDAIKVFQELKYCLEEKNENSGGNSWRRIL